MTTSLDTTFVSQTTVITTAWAQNVNDTIWKGRDPNFITSTGSGTAYTITLATGSLYATPVLGDTFSWKVSVSNTGPATLAIVGSTTLGPYPLTKQGSTALAAGDILIGAVVTCTFDGTNFQVQNVTSSGGGSMPLFTQTGTGAVARTFQSKEEDVISFKDFGAVGNGIVEDGAKLATAITAHAGVELPAGTYKNSTTAVTLPFTKTLHFKPAATVVNSGSGSLTANGIVIKSNNNPSSTSGWTDTAAAYNYEGLSVDFGGYGNKQFGTKGIPTALVGSIKIPSTSTIANHSVGTAGYASSASTTTGAVGVYAEGNCAAANALAWGANTIVKDNGNATTLWSIEADVNVNNINSIPIGVNVVGGSTVEPANSIAFWCGALGEFTSPKKRWLRAFFSDDACAQTALEVGSASVNANSASQNILMYGRNSSAVRELQANIYTDTSGNLILQGKKATALTALATSDLSAPIKIQDGNKLGIYGAVPIAKPTITGSKGGNAALTSLLSQLATMGLITDSTT